MVRKIGGPKPPSISQSTPVQPASVTGTEKVGTVHKVDQAGQKEVVGRARRPTRPMTEEERQHLLRLLTEEADKMFSENGIPATKRETVEGAVKMALEASSLEVEIDEEQS